MTVHVSGWLALTPVAGLEVEVLVLTVKPSSVVTASGHYLQDINKKLINFIKQLFVMKDEPPRTLLFHNYSVHFYWSEVY